MSVMESIFGGVDVLTKKTRKMLDERIEKEIKMLDSLSPNDQGYQLATNRLEALIKARYDTVDNGVSKWLKVGVDIFGVGAPLIFYGIWMRRGLEFEKTGAFSSSVFRGLTSKFRPTK